MKKVICLFMMLVVVLLVGCTENETIEKLTRVDVFHVTVDGNYADEIIIADPSSVDELNQVFDRIEWERNVKAEMSRKEDVKAVLFLEDDVNMPERLVEYKIWFEGNGTSTIKESDSYGRLDEVGTKILKDVFEFEDK
ncbi:hypothetical protein KD050_09020 [Psychrobacillus sp. INOP01]|uniref:hypothetical protein n=1 Tax=Psychrobacillus sp. INOP01 TaxID=2829187 RepID=UPI001BACC0CB|nr:hypothetical protein [Psychrobacillus sp. INOP01]QUG43344.1 hypothetical protein KD050_09020 [Psychrobacillus sp. INOP01]